MRKTALLLALGSAVVLVSGDRTIAQDSTTLTGRYNSGYQNSERPLEAVFSATGEERWSVEFYFNFDGRDHTYVGTARGSLSEGLLQGRVQNESRQRTFTFRGEFENGKFKGTHAEVDRRGRSQRTGTLTLQQ